MLNFSLLEQQQKVITSFGDTPSVPVTQQELTDAENQITEEEKTIQEDDDEHREAHTREEPESSMEYGTPSGIGNVPSTCPGCSSGCSDVADAAIIDAEIAPAKSTDEQESTEDTETSEDTDTGTNDTAELSAMLKLRENFIISEEAYEEVDNPITSESVKRTWEVLKDGVVAGSILLIRFTKAIFDFGVAVYRFVSNNYGVVRDLGMKIFASSETIANYWSERVAKRLNKIDEAKLSEMKVTMLDRVSFEKIIDSLIDINKFIVSNRKMLVDSSKQANSKVEELTKKVEKLGIKIDSATDEVDVSKITDNRVVNDLISHGYTPSKMTPLLRKISDIHKQYKANGDSSILVMLKDMQKAIDTMNKTVQSVEDEKIANAIAESMLKMRYLVQVITVTHNVTVIMLDDFVEVAKDYDIAANSEEE